jgi:diadenosine tetraphosphatase ApaH/serine/threonine PP2A family protein phosphatase
MTPGQNRSRTALTFYVGDFKGALDPLPFEEPVTAFRETLRRYGYNVEVLDGIADAATLRQTVDDAIAAHRPGATVIVHLLSHAKSDRGLHLMLPDALTHDELELTAWIARHRRADGAPNRPNLLFVLDLCHAGVAADLQWWDDEENDVRTFVWAAGRAGEKAFDARFTLAIGTVLSTLAADESAMDIAPGAEHLPWDVLRRRVWTEVATLSRGRTPQRPIGRPDHVQEDPPFFDNRHYRRRALEKPASEIGAVVFRGRQATLREIDDWLHRDAHTDPFLVITGRAGVGKSALLDQVGRRPSWPGLLVPGRDLDAGRLARLIGAYRGLTDSTPEAIVRAVAAGAPLLLAVDALDEAADPAGIIERILMPLARAGAGCRIVIAARTRPALSAEATSIDLDRADRTELRAALSLHVQDLLLGNERPPELKVAAAFAIAVAGRLVPDDDSLVTVWGEFLVATIHSRAELDRATEPWDERKARRLGRRVPTGVSDLVEEALAIEGESRPWLRRVLTALAWARGPGMPVDVLGAAAAYVAGSPADPPTSTVVSECLAAAKYYVDRTAGPEGLLHYRLFHPSLDEYLLRPEDAAALFDAVRDSVPVRADDRRDWTLAAPYTRRHLLEHAAAARQLADALADADYLTTGTADIGDALDAAEHLADTDELREALRAARAVHSDDGSRLDRAIVAAHYEAPLLAARLTAALPTAWHPRWVFGPRGDRGAATAEPVSEAQLLFLDNDGQLTTYDVGDDYRPRHLGGFATTYASTKLLAFVEDGVQYVATADYQGAVRLWTSSDGEVLLRAPGTPLTSLAHGREALLAGDRYGRVLIWQLGDGDRVPRPLEGELPVRFMVVTAIDDYETVVLPGAGGQVIVRALAGSSALRVLDHGGDTVLDAISLTLPGGTPGLLTLAESGAVKVWNLPRHRPVAEGRIPVSAEPPVIARLDESRAVIDTGWSAYRVDASSGDLHIEKLPFHAVDRMMTATRVGGRDIAFVVHDRGRAVTAHDLDDPAANRTFATAGPTAAVAMLAGSPAVPEVRVGAVTSVDAIVVAGAVVVAAGTGDSVETVRLWPGARIDARNSIPVAAPGRLAWTTRSARPALAIAGGPSMSLDPRTGRVRPDGPPIGPEPAPAGESGTIADLSYSERRLGITGTDDGRLRLISLDDGEVLDEVRLDAPVRQFMVVPGWRIGTGAPDTVVALAGGAVFVLEVVPREGGFGT